MSDGPKCLDQLIAIHADAIVLNSERFFIGIDGKRDSERRVTAEQRGAGDCFSLSQASAALEISSRKKTSLSE